MLDGFIPRLPEHDWIEVAHVYEGERAGVAIRMVHAERAARPSTLTRIIEKVDAPLALLAGVGLTLALVR